MRLAHSEAFSLTSRFLSTISESNESSYCPSLDKLTLRTKLNQTQLFQTFVCCLPAQTLRLRFHLKWQGQVTIGWSIQHKIQSRNTSILKKYDKVRLSWDVITLTTKLRLRARAQVGGGAGGALECEWVVWPSSTPHSFLVSQGSRDRVGGARVSLADLF